LIEGDSSGIISGTESSTERSEAMNTIPAQEIKRRGIAAVDELIAKGDLHIIRNNQPQYVVLSQKRYEDLLEAEEEAAEARLRASLADLKAGRVRRFASADELIQALDLEG
jgi:PHD/YefM family antitoxin component YafN of YafNO toxin-antitoxin module